MENFYLLILIGFLIGTVGTLIGAGGGFILVPLLIIFHPEFSPGDISAISMAVVAFNAISGSVTYVANKRVDYKAGTIFAICTIPGSILGVMTTAFIPRHLFDLVFGVVLFALAIFLFAKGGRKKPIDKSVVAHKGWVRQQLTDRWGETYQYSYDIRKGSFLSVLVGYFSPLLGIGGGIIHVPAMVEWLRFPVHIATATSHFILAVMAAVSVVVHYSNGGYDNPIIWKMALGLIVGVIPGAQLGAYLSRKIGGKAIIRSLAVCLAIVGIRIFVTRFL